MSDPADLLSQRHSHPSRRELRITSVDPRDQFQGLQPATADSAIDQAGEVLLATDAGVKALGAILFLKDAWEEMTPEEKDAASLVISDIVVKPRNPQPEKEAAAA